MKLVLDRGVQGLRNKEIKRDTEVDASWVPGGSLTSSAGETDDCPEPRSTFIYTPIYKGGSLENLRLKELGRAQVYFISSFPLLDWFHISKPSSRTWTKVSQEMTTPLHSWGGVQRT